MSNQLTVNKPHSLLTLDSAAAIAITEQRYTIVQQLFAIFSWQLSKCRFNETTIAERQFDW